MLSVDHSSSPSIAAPINESSPLHAYLCSALIYLLSMCWCEYATGLTHLTKRRMQITGMKTICFVLCVNPLWYGWEALESRKSRYYFITLVTLWLFRMKNRANGGRAPLPFVLFPKICWHCFNTCLKTFLWPKRFIARKFVFRNWQLINILASLERKIQNEISYAL